MNKPPIDHEFVTRLQAVIKAYGASDGVGRHAYGPVVEFGIWCASQIENTHHAQALVLSDWSPNPPAVMCEHCEEVPAAVRVSTYTESDDHRGTELVCRDCLVGIQDDMYNRNGRLEMTEIDQ